VIVIGGRGDESGALRLGIMWYSKIVCGEVAISCYVNHFLHLPSIVRMEEGRRVPVLRKQNCHSLGSWICRDRGIPFPWAENVAKPLVIGFVDLGFVAEQ